MAHIINHFWKRWSIWSDYDSAKKLFNRVIIYPLYLSPASGWLKIGHKSEKWQWRHNLLTWRHCQFFKHCFVFLVKFSYWCKFHVNIITGSGQFSFIGDCPISGDWGELEIPNLARISNEMLLNAAKCQGHSFYRVWVIKGKPTGWWGWIISPTHPG